jgi:hypothetical protein
LAKGKVESSPKINAQEPILFATALAHCNAVEKVQALKSYASRLCNKATELFLRVLLHYFQ